MLENDQSQNYKNALEHLMIWQKITRSFIIGITLVNVLVLSYLIGNI
tara:strand:+ start:577 stop:717 length:141 start_codon:yes stop_codon:yes gene_type:complete